MNADPQREERGRDGHRVMEDMGKDGVGKGRDLPFGLTGDGVRFSSEPERIDDPEELE